MKALRYSLFLLLFAGFGLTASAQLSLGGGVSYNLDAEEVGINVRGVYGFTETLRGQAGFTYYLVGDGLTLTEFNLNGNYVFSGEPGGTMFYGLAGLNFFSASVDLGQFGGKVSATETGLNLGGGVNLGLSDSVMFYGEAKYVLSDASGLVLTAGVLFNL